MTDWTPEAIRALKKRLGLTGSQLAKECGVIPRTVRYWMQSTNTNKPGGSALLHLDRLSKRAAAKKVPRE